MLRFVSEKQIDAILQHAMEDLPNECCGMIAGKGEVVDSIVRLKNELKSPISYKMNNNEVKSVLDKLDKNGLDFIGIYHSHPTSDAYPSMTDVAQAIFPEIDYIIISLKNTTNPKIKNFKIRNDSITEEPFTVAR